MKAQQLLNAIGNVDDTFLTEMLEEKKTTARFAGKRLWLIAAIVSAMLLLMGCGWVVLHMQSLKLGEETLYYDVFNDEGFAGR